MLSTDQLPQENKAKTGALQPVCRDNLFEFRAVGQGLFYTGILDNGNYAFVYDCGTESPQSDVQREIDEFILEVSKTNKKQIDFAVISHLHRDHFSGLHSLIKHVGVKKVYLPYLGRKESNLNLKKLLIARALTNNATDSQGRDRQEIFMWALNLYERGRTNNDEPQIVFLGEEGTNVHFPCPEGLSDTPFWRFVLFNKRVKESELKKLEDKISKALRGKKIVKIEECLQTTDGIQKILQAYTKVFCRAKFNKTSTVMLHYPITVQKSFLICEKNRSRPFHDPYEEKQNGKKRIVTVLTGDAEFDDEMRQSLNKELEKMEFSGILHIPHHGSKTNWEMLKELRCMFDRLVVSFGLGNKHWHPSLAVVNEILENNNKILYFSTQVHSVRYSISTK